MYVRDAKNRDEAWLLDHIEAMGLDDAAFRSRDYVIAVDQKSNERVGFGRLRVHKTDPERCELTGIGVLEGWRGQGVGAHVIERLVDTAEIEGFDSVYTLTDEAEYLEQFGFERVPEADLPERLRERLAEKRETVSEDVVALELPVEAFSMPDHLREAFKRASEGTGEEAEPEPEDTAEDFGIDPDEATYKYDTGS
ncbi:GNAT family N-acetyltransferase [Haloparvum sedimenti]|uniref:GNAT family N-acetyltransferase n=1 Tax=Haloparvum sedimenti TaxID=1678448 RepID=UPI00071E9BC4|nr:GNAT family N-acetyltransferase [Haloparvum sedimenti]